MRSLDVIALLWNCGNRKKAQFHIFFKFFHSLCCVVVKNIPNIISFFSRSKFLAIIAKLNICFSERTHGKRSTSVNRNIAKIDMWKIKTKHFIHRRGRERNESEIYENWKHKQFSPIKPSRSYENCCSHFFLLISLFTVFCWRWWWSEKIKLSVSDGTLKISIRHKVDEMKINKKKKTFFCLFLAMVVAWKVSRVLFIIRWTSVDSTHVCYWLSSFRSHFSAH